MPSTAMLTLTRSGSTPGDMIIHSVESADVSLQTFFESLKTVDCNKMSLVLIAVLVVLFFVTRAVYRLWFSPLAHIPGPKIAGKIIHTLNHLASDILFSFDFLVLRIS